MKHVTFSFPELLAKYPAPLKKLIEKHLNHLAILILLAPIQQTEQKKESKPLPFLLVKHRQVKKNYAS